MDFFAEQDRARRNTRRLLVLFALAVLCLIVLTNLVVAWALWQFDAGTLGTWKYVVNAPALDGAQAPPGFFAYLTMPLFLGIGAAVSTAVVLASGVKHLQLARGGASVAEMLDGQPVEPASTEPAERRLLNIVEEMAIAAGLPVPPVYRVPGEGINAFAAGFAPDDAVIGITDGALSRLSRDELQGVMGHEFSHILNGDMRLNLRLIAVLHGILFIAQAGRVLFDSGRDTGTRAGRRGGSLALVGLALLLIGFCGVFFGRLIKAGVSREREFLADAAAVQLTRNPLGLAGALRKIGGPGAAGTLASVRAEEASHLFFAQAIAMRMQSWFATHPPLAKRIRRLDPAWNGRFEAPLPSAQGDAPVAPAPVGVSTLADVAGDDALEFTDAPAPRDIETLPRTLPAEPIAGLSGALRLACRDTTTVGGVVCAALVDPASGVAARQVAAATGAGFAPPPDLAGELRDAALVPVLELATPALARLAESERARLWATIEASIMLDDHLDARELCAAVVLERHLCAQSRLGRATQARYRRLEQVTAPLSVLLSVLVHATPGEASARFLALQRELRTEGLQLLQEPVPDWSALRAALAVLRGLFPLLKPRLLKACRVALAAEGSADANAKALLGLLAAVLDCPAVIVNES